MINVATNLVENEAKPVKSSLYCFWEYPLSPGTDPRGAWEQNYHNVRINISAKFGSASNQNLYLYYVLQFALHRDKEVEE